jgi:hypothetical protein
MGPSACDITRGAELKKYMKIEKIEKKRGRGRPPFTRGQPKKSVVHLRVTAQEKADWVRSALPTTLSAWITRTLRGASEKKPPIA